MKVILIVLLLLSMNLPLRTYMPEVNVETLTPVIEIEVVSDTPHYINNMKRNNPFNIRTNDANKWVGKEPNNTEPFEKFSTLEYGLRAGMLLLHNYNLLYNVNTIEEIIYKFAPPIENNTLGYIHRVCKNTGFKPDESLDLFDKDVMIRLAIEMIVVETNTKLPYSLLEQVYDKYICT